LRPVSLSLFSLSICLVRSRSLSLSRALSLSCARSLSLLWLFLLCLSLSLPRCLGASSSCINMLTRAWAIVHTDDEHSYSRFAFVLAMAPCIAMFACKHWHMWAFHRHMWAVFALHVFARACAPLPIFTLSFPPIPTFTQTLPPSELPLPYSVHGRDKLRNRESRAEHVE